MKNIQNILEIRSLSQYMSDKMTVGGTYSDRILIFDIDDTLLKSHSKIEVVKDGKVIRELTPAEYNYYKLNPGEEYDYKQFRSYDALVNATLLPFFNTLKKEYRKGTHIAICTARPEGDMFKKFFLSKGIDIKDELILATGDDKQGYHGSVEDRKVQAFEMLINLGYKTFVFFDDSEVNLKAAKEMEKDYPIKVITVKA